VPCPQTMRRHSQTARRLRRNQLLEVPGAIASKIPDAEWRRRHFSTERGLGHPARQRLQQGTDALAGERLDEAPRPPGCASSSRRRATRVREESAVGDHERRRRSRVIACQRRPIATPQSCVTSATGDAGARTTGQAPLRDAPTWPADPQRSLRSRVGPSERSPALVCEHGAGVATCMTTREAVDEQRPGRPNLPTIGRRAPLHAQ
jgi:hypothetical protein